MATIDLTEREIVVLRSALDSAEYWEHKDNLDHDSGYILDPEPGSEEEQSEAWEEVLEIRALDARLAELEKAGERCGYRCCGDPCVLVAGHDGDHAIQGAPA